MYLVQLDIEYRVIIGISAMVLLFASFLVVFISSQRKKLQYHKNLHALHEEQQQVLRQQNLLLEKRVHERTSELLHQKESLQQSLQDLKAAQLQLVQQEKMASLGELTAGIAHEIQNPLNFINNFSEVSAELASELKEGPFQCAPPAVKEEADELLNDLIQNLQKITLHGKRADAIVKSMLLHARKTGDQKEKININKLADEYLRLSFHGLRAKDKTFNTELQTNFDDNLPEVNAVPQEIGRVLLNLFNNAFYSVHQKKAIAGASYTPVVMVSTKAMENGVEVCIKDNGMGIPKKILDKIYLPFFTTKPVGEGTGLGLSLSYDIITRSHGGKLQVTTEEGAYAEFRIFLPA